MRLYFARHGESQANILHELANRGLKHGLTRRGREQAAQLALTLRNQPIHIIYSSPLLRAIETSITVAHALALDYEITPALREYDCGIFEGRSDEAAWQAWQMLFDAWLVERRWDMRLDEGENFYDVRDRFVPFINGLVRQYGETDINIVCIAHGGLYWMMLPMILKNVNVALINQYRFEYASSIIAECRAGELWCISWNDIPIA